MKDVIYGIKDPGKAEVGCFYVPIIYLFFSGFYHLIPGTADLGRTCVGDSEWWGVITLLRDGFTVFGSPENPGSQAQSGRSLGWTGQRLPESQSGFTLSQSPWASVSGPLHLLASKTYCEVAYNILHFTFSMCRMFSHTFKPGDV